MTKLQNALNRNSSHAQSSRELDFRGVDEPKSSISLLKSTQPANLTHDTRIATHKLDSIESRFNKNNENIESKIQDSKKNIESNLFFNKDSKNTESSLFSSDKSQNIAQDSININNLRFCISPKYDGMSLNLYYKNGELVSATTRGDGEVGELVTQNARMIESIPQRIPFKGEIEIRGEVVMRKEIFEMLNKERGERGEPLFANPRNAASGSMRQLDCNLVKERKLDFIPWGIGFCSDLESLKKMARDRI
ncbi:hypothetical protein DCO60_10495 [Helicobacter saguini]|nr:hypothetical protein [Helicobacter saguini]MWV71600.1 hypothetical protein [Helicobacter saguini]TLD94482.1 hypothetical protein LS64_005590 [Helicobacter saguini]